MRRVAPLLALSAMVAPLLGLGACSDSVTGPLAGADESRPPELWSVTYGAGRFVAVGKRETWSTTSTPSSTWKSLADTAVAVWSDDGSTWYPVELPQERGWLRAVAYGNDLFLTVGGIGNWLDADGYLLRSSDGTQWSLTAAPLGLKCNWLTFLDEHFFASCAEGSGSQTRNVVARSTNGLAWERMTTVTERDAPIASGNGVIVRWDGGGLRWSDNGTDWQTHPPLFPERDENDLRVIAAIRNVAYVDDAFIGSAYTYPQSAPCCPGPRTAYTLRSVDGRNWTAERTDPPLTFWDHARGNGVFVAVGDAGLFAAVEPGEWSLVHPFLPNERHFSVAFEAGRFVTVGTAGILTSVDGYAWVKTSIPLPD